MVGPFWPTDDKTYIPVIIGVGPGTEAPYPVIREVVLLTLMVHPFHVTVLVVVSVP